MHLGNRLGALAGVFSAIDAAGVGAIMALLVAILRRALNWANIKDVTSSTLKSTGSVFLILFRAFVFKTFVGFTDLPFKMSVWVEARGFSGKQVVILLEMALISPPVSINVFVVKGIAPDVTLGTIFRGIWPFWFAMAAVVILIVLIPQIALVLPKTMFG